jgi:hypothetical protein
MHMNVAHCIARLAINGMLETTDFIYIRSNSRYKHIYICAYCQVYEDNLKLLLLALQNLSPCGGGLEYFHRNPCES